LFGDLILKMFGDLILKNIYFYVLQKREIHTGLEQHEGDVSELCMNAVTGL